MAEEISLGVVVMNQYASRSGFRPRVPATVTVVSDPFREACIIARITPEEAAGPCRKQKVYVRRAYVMWLLRQRGWTLNQIGRRMGDRDHTTIHHGIKKWEGMAHMFNQDAAE